MMSGAWIREIEISEVRHMLYIGVHMNTCLF